MQENSAFYYKIQSMSTKPKNTLMRKWHLIQNQRLLREIYQEPAITSNKRGRPLKDILVTAKLYKNVNCMTSQNLQVLYYSP